MDQEKPRVDVIKRLSNHLADEIDRFFPDVTDAEMLTAVAMLATAACIELKLSRDKFLIAMQQMEEMIGVVSLIPTSN